MRKISIFLGLSLLAGCALTATQSAAITSAVTAATTLETDIATDIQSASATGAIPATALVAINAQLTTLQTDIAALSAGNTTAATVEADVQSAIMDAAPYVPEIAALITTAAKKGVVAPTSVIATHFDAAEQALHAI
jgi:hypothetical protein